jgi:hypothetical protein
MKLNLLTLAAVCLAATTTFAQDINFGDDNGEFALDGICDDRRFEGAVMEVGLGWDHVASDATDCRAAFEAGTISQWNLQDGIARTDCAAVDFGTNASEYANDGACDDPRFEGLGEAELPSFDNLGTDAADCQKLCNFDLIFLRDMEITALPEPEPVDEVYGDNTGEYPNDGECDDRRFVGSAMANSLGWGSTGRDADDCRAAVEAGSITLWDQQLAAEQTVCSAIDFGNDSSDYANDGTCDDIRFEGRGAAAQISYGDEGHDATDCSRMCDYGMIFVRETE